MEDNGNYRCWKKYIADHNLFFIRCMSGLKAKNMVSMERWIRWRMNYRNNSRDVTEVILSILSNISKVWYSKNRDVAAVLETADTSLSEAQFTALLQKL